MPAAAEIQKVLAGCYLWQAYCSKARVILTSHALVFGREMYLIDPIRLEQTGLDELDKIGAQVSAVLLTNGNHERDATFFRDRYGIPIYATPEAAAEFLLDTLEIPDQLGGLLTIRLPGAGPGEIGLYDPTRKLLCLGDIIINLDSFAFAPLPDKYAVDPKKMRKSIQSLTKHEVSTICFAHGLPVTKKASERLASLVS